MRNIALQLMYVGTAYHGWQIQKNAVSVEETLEKCLQQVIRLGRELPYGCRDESNPTPSPKNIFQSTALLRDFSFKTLPAPGSESLGFYPGLTQKEIKK